MFDIIVATDQNNGIGKNGKLPWDIKIDMKFFKTKTLETEFPNQINAIIMGWNTWQSIPIKYRPLKDRINIIVTQKHAELIKESDCLFTVENFEDALIKAHELKVYNTYVIGGGHLYLTALKNHNLNNIYITKIYNNFECDTHFIINNKMHLRESSEIIEDVDLISKKYIKLQFIKYQNPKHEEYQYLNLLSKVIQKGEERQTRNAKTLSIFGEQIKFDISEGFPLLTTKRMYWKGIVEELLFFIRGDTNSKHLEEKGINIWQGNTTTDFLNKVGLDSYEEGDMGPMYGYQWRSYNKPYNIKNKYVLEKVQTGIEVQTGIDQLQNCIDMIKNDPTNRRILLTAYNPCQLKESVLAPCHSIVVQFYVKENKLSCHMYQRSADTFLGLPFNIASTSLLTYLIAKITNLNPGEVIISLGDTHLYKDHIEMANRQLNRVPFKFPKLEILKDIKNIVDIENMTMDDFNLINYQCHKGIKASMVA